MNELNQNNNAFQQGAEAEEGIKIKDVIALCLKNWGWIALSVVLCLGAGVFYLMKTPPVYTRSASHQAGPQGQNDHRRRGQRICRYGAFCLQLKRLQ